MKPGAIMAACWSANMRAVNHPETHAGSATANAETRPLCAARGSVTAALYPAAAIARIPTSDKPHACRCHLAGVSRLRDSEEPLDGVSLFLKVKLELFALPTIGAHHDTYHARRA